jgi:hypothetical protein
MLCSYFLVKFIEINNRIVVASNESYSVSQLRKTAIWWDVELTQVS